MSIRFTNIIGQALTRNGAVPSIDITMCAWIKSIAAPVNMALDLNNVGGSEFNIATGAATQIAFGDNGSSTINLMKMPQKTWCFVAATSAGGVAAAGYFRVSGAVAIAGQADGALIKAATNALLGGPTYTDLFVGAENAGAAGWNGDIAYLKLWNATLTYDELIDEMNSGPPQRTANLNSYYPFYRVDSATIDYSGNGRNLVMGVPPVNGEDNPPCSAM